MGNGDAGEHRFFRVDHERGTQAVKLTVALATVDQAEQRGAKDEGRTNRETHPMTVARWRRAAHCQIRIDTLRAPHLIMTTVSGDLQGPARLEIRPDGTGSSARPTA